jgi:hypothetical protein
MPKWLEVRITEVSETAIYLPLQLLLSLSSSVKINIYYIYISMQYPICSVIVT